MGGAPRSGTTLLRNLLDRHPGIRAGAETKLFVPGAFNLAWLAEAYEVPRPELDAMRRSSASQAAFIDAFAVHVRTAAGKGRWAEKTPQNIRHLDWILARFPGASVIHIIRDGRDVICSMRQHPDWRWLESGWQKVPVPRSLAWYAQRWLADTAAGMAWQQDSRYVEVRYEDLVSDPGATMRAVCDGIGEPAGADWLTLVGRRAGPAEGGGDAGDVGQTADAMDQPTGRLDYEGAVSDASVGRWRTELSAAEQREVMRHCGTRLRELGYEV